MPGWWGVVSCSRAVHEAEHEALVAAGGPGLGVGVAGRWVHRLCPGTQKAPGRRVASGGFWWFLGSGVTPSDYRVHECSGWVYTLVR